MRAIARLICLFGILSLVACGAAESDHALDEGGEAHAHDGADMHEHAEGGHAHDAPETEAFYADEAGTVDAAPDPGVTEDADQKKDEDAAEIHAHGEGEPHTHDH